MPRVRLASALVGSLLLGAGGDRPSSTLAGAIAYGRGVRTRSAKAAFQAITKVAQHAEVWE
jgi:hypothetical protein